MDNEDRGPELAYWVPEQAVRNLEMERALNGHESHVELAKRLFKENLPMAVMSVNHLALYSPREEIRLAAAKYVVEQSMGAPGKNDLPTGKHAWDSVHAAVLIESARINKSKE